MKMSRQGILIKRTGIVVSGGSARLVSTMGSALISLAIVRSQSAGLWGEVVPFMLLVEFGFSIINWGSGPYLVQEFSLHPDRMRADWSRSVFTRSGLLVCYLVFLLFLSLTVSQKFGLMGWAIGRYVYQSFDPIAQVERKFVFSIVVEITAMAIIILPVLAQPQTVTIDEVVFLFAASMVWRAVGSLVFFRKWITGGRPDPTFLKTTFPFFMLSLTGMLLQRTDLYCVTWMLNEEETAVYQVYFNFLIFAQFLGSLLLSPFAKNILRLPGLSLERLEKRFVTAGLLLSAASMGAIYFIVRYFYHFELSWLLYALGYVYVLMVYAYLPRNYSMGKAYKQLTVAAYSLLGSAFNFLVCITLIPRYGMEGAMIAGCASQVLIAVLYRRWKPPGYAEG